MTIPSSTIHAHVESLRRKHPQATPEEVIRLLEKEYLLVVQGTGGAVGATAAAPAVGTGVALALTASDVATFFGRRRRSRSRWPACTASRSRTPTDVAGCC